MDSLGFYIGHFFVAYYGLMIVTGILVSSAVGYYQIKKFNKNYNDFIIIIAFEGLCSMIGAKLLYLILFRQSIDVAKLTDLEYVNSLMTGGFVFYGGLIGGLIGLVFLNRLFQIDVSAYLEIAIPCLPIAHAFGRIGCNMVGCCYGCSYQGIGSTVYEQSLFAPNGTSLFPVQAAEAMLNFIIAIILLIYINRYSGKKAFELYLLMYSVVRFILEFFRGDDMERKMFKDFSTSQYISIMLVALILIVKILRKKTTAKTINGSI